MPLQLLRCGAALAAGSALGFLVAAPHRGSGCLAVLAGLSHVCHEHGCLHATAAAAGPSAPAGLETHCCCCVNVAHAHPFRLLSQFFPMPHEQKWYTQLLPNALKALQSQV